MSWRTLFICLGSFLLFGLAAQKESKKELNLKLISIELEHSNPSLGPHEKKTSFTYSFTDDQDMAEKLLSETQVNGVATLKEYSEAFITQNSARIEKIQKAYEARNLKSGAPISNLTLSFEGQQSVRLHDLRNYSISGYYRDSFLKVLVEKGRKYVSSPSKPKRPHEDEPAPVNRTVPSKERIVQDPKKQQ